MIIDVIDMGIEKLQFSRKYEENRREKGKKIKKNGFVNIQTVEKINENTYTVNAVINGNNDDYDTYIKIHGNMIEEESCTCQDYKNGNLCKHIIATAMEVVDPYRATTKEGISKLKRIEREKIKERLKEMEKQREEEKRQREYAIKYHKSLDIIERFKRNYENNEEILDLPKIYERALEQGKENAISGIPIKIEVNVEEEYNKTLKISFKIGQTRMYILSSLRDFYKAYRNGSKIYYGKQLSFTPKREIFTPESQKWFDFIIQYAKLIDYNEKFNNHSYGASRDVDRFIYINEDNIEDFFNVNGNDKIKLKKYPSGDVEEYIITNEKIEIKCILQKEKVKIDISNFWDINKNILESDEYVLKLNVSDYKEIYSKENIYFFYNKKIYKLKREKEIIEMLDIFKNSDKLLIPEDKFDIFEQYMLPKIRNIEIRDLPQSIEQEAKIVDKLASKILLDIDEEGNILLDLKFCYNEYEFNILQDNFEEYVKENKIVRDVPAEREVIERIFTDGFELDKKNSQFLMKNADSIYEFITNKIEEYMQDFEVLVTDKFKNREIKRPKITNLGVKIDNGLLQVDISKINIDFNEIQDVLKSYNIKKRYHKLKNGDFLDLTNNQDLDLLSEMTETLDIDYGKMKEGIVKLPVNRSYYLDKLMNSNTNINVSKNKEFTELIDNMENTNISDKIKLNKDMESKLRDYQKVGYRWLKTLSLYNLGGILADDMGLGKTLQVIAVLESELHLKKKKTSIVVSPSTLVLNWKAEIEKWCNDIKVLIINGNAIERKEKIESYKEYDVIITSYDLLKRDIDIYEDKQFRYIIADEAQYIKNASTQNSTSLKSLNGEVKFALTGTPIENSVAELWSIFDFIMPGYLYNYNKFKKKFEEPILKQEDTETLKRLKKLISPFVLRRVKKDVLTELPEKNITIMKNEMEKEQEKIYLSYLAQTKKEVAQELQGNSFEKSKFKILMLLTRLRQICCHPSLFIENYNEGSGKLEQCLNLVNEAIDGGHKILIFSSYTSMFDILEKELNKANIKYFKLIGKTPVSQRITMVDEFNKDSTVKVFLISLKAGGTGLNLTSADVVIHYDPWWNVSSENQATDRAYRIGQKNSVQVYKLITSNSIEEKINKMQERKAKLSENVLSTEETFINKLSKEEILDLFE